MTRVEDIIIGHRGAAGHAPENTLASIRRAAGFGLGWVEFDVKLSRDEALILFHDDRLDRTTDGRGTVAAWDLSRLRRLDAGTWFDTAFAGERIPTLDETVAVLRDCRLGAHLEIKPCPGRERLTGERVGAFLRSRWPAAPGSLVISSFSRAALEACHEESGGCDLAWLVEEPPAHWPRVLDELGAGSLHCAEQWTTPPLVRAVHARGRKIRAYTVNDGDRAQRLLDMGVDGLFTDFPDRTGPA